MVTALLYPYWLFVFWYKDASVSFLKTCFAFNEYFIQLFSISLLLKTFFRPLKNEYRAGLVGFSIILGIFVKTVLILLSLMLLLSFLLIECVMFVLFLSLPALIIYVILT